MLNIDFFIAIGKCFKIIIIFWGKVCRAPKVPYAAVLLLVNGGFYDQELCFLSALQGDVTGFPDAAGISFL